MAKIHITDDNILIIEINDAEGNTIVKWHIDSSGVLVKQEGKLKCVICGGEVKPHYLGAVHKPFRGRAFDFNVKCTNCSWFSVFGNPIPDEKLAEKLKMFAGKWVIFIEDELKERLDSWGYW